MFKKEKRKSWRSVQSPFIFNLARHLEAGSRYVDERVVEDEVEYDKIFKDIENLRADLKRSTDTIAVEDHGAGSRVFKGSSRKVSKIAKHVLQGERVAKSLWKVLRFWGMHLEEKGNMKLSVLEMGTSLGVTTAYLSAAGCDVETWEGCQNTADVARNNWIKLGLDKHIDSKVGKFDELLKSTKGGWDMVFLDGHHDGGATLRYVEELKSKLSTSGCVLVDDVVWSKGMKTAWRELLDDSYWNVTVRWRGKGWLFHIDGAVEQHIALSCVFKF
jgi:hypothetical protein